ncbi:unnamed protein product [Lasius platythorax]|uniref:Uncharacterized protein n=1 Tax=Lasius platythorax TaxID=488582 RepID=A0AAV2NB70_9HYME
MDSSAAALAFDGLCEHARIRRLKYVEMLNEADFHGIGRRMGIWIFCYERNSMPCTFVPRRNTRTKMIQWCLHNAGQRHAEIFNKAAKHFY